MIRARVGLGSGVIVPRRRRRGSLATGPEPIGRLYLRARLALPPGALIPCGP